ncbi:MAG: hypothetical protein ACLQUY_19585 [Ktedonobacterales bacterium]
MRGQRQQAGEWDDEDGESYEGYGVAPEYGYDSYEEQYSQESSASEAWDDDERGLMLEPEHSLVGISKTVTHHGVPLLSYTRTMNRFYTTRRQRLSLGRFKCEVCGERIRWWAWETGNGTRTHDGCYERLAWTWTNLYAQQQKLASQGLFE